jgi:Tfp pilus assembly ATPase PilU
MRDTAYVKELIRKNEVENIRDGMLRGGTAGCVTFDQSLVDLYAAGLISHQEAMSNADYPNDIRLKLEQARPVAVSHNNRHQQTQTGSGNQEPAPQAPKLELAKSWTPEQEPQVHALG